MIDFSMCDANKRVIDSFRPLPPETVKSLRDFYRIGLTYTSNAIEGSSVTEAETKVIIEDGLTVKGKPLREVYEVLGHAKAYDFIYELAERRRLTEKDILQLHQFFYSQIDSVNAGNYRTAQVFICGSHYRLPHFAQVPEQMREFVAWFNRNEHKLHPVEFAAEVHRRFVFIHPFIDGNGRMSRLLMNLALLRAGFTVAVIPPILRAEYIASLETAHKEPSSFVLFIRDREIEAQRELIRLFGESATESGGVKNEDGGVNGGVKNKAAAMEDKLVAVIRQLPGINAPALTRQLAIPLRTVQRHLAKLCKDGVIAFRGAPKTGGYVVVLK